MKKLKVSWMLLLPFIMWAQERGSSLQYRHDIYANLFYASGGYIEAGYEYGFHQKWGLGLTGGLLVDNDANNHITEIVTADVKIEPYLRRYFGKQTRSGFFVQSSAAWLKDAESYDVSRDSRFGIGIAFGATYILPKNWLLEVKLGGGTELGKDQSAANNSPYDYDIVGSFDLYPNIGLSFGKRF